MDPRRSAREAPGPQGTAAGAAVPRGVSGRSVPVPADPMVPALMTGPGPMCRPRRVGLWGWEGLRAVHPEHLVLVGVLRDRELEVIALVGPGVPVGLGGADQAGHRDLGDDLIATGCHVVIPGARVIDLLASRGRPAQNREAARTVGQFG